MYRIRLAELIVGFFIIAGAVAFFMLSMRVAGMSHYNGRDYYTVIAEFDNIGDLKPRAPVTIAGVRVGEVGKIDLDNNSFRARVRLKIADNQNKIPFDSSAAILTEGLLGSNYISITPGFGGDNGDKYLQDGSAIDETHSALILENLIGQLVYKFTQNGSVKKDKDKEKGDE